VGWWLWHRSWRRRLSGGCGCDVIGRDGGDLVGVVVVTFSVVAAET